VANQTKAQLVAELQALITGLQKQFPNGKFTLNNTAFTTKTLVQAIQRLIAAINAVNTVQAEEKTAVETLRTTKAQVGPVVLALKRNLQSMYGNTTNVLARFGLEPRKAPAPRTTEEKAASAVKARGTREARGTASKKQKRAVKGNVTGITVTPVIAPAEVPPPALPATTAPAASTPVKP
jgi:hypothetical protein